MRMSVRVQIHIYSLILAKHGFQYLSTLAIIQILNTTIRVDYVIYLQVLMLSQSAPNSVFALCCKVNPISLSPSLTGNT